MNALEIKNLTKEFPGFRLDNISLTLPSGCILGLVGENGAGKSTTIRLILDILHKDGGTVTILGKDNEDNISLTKEEVGVVFDETGIPDCFTTRDTGEVMSRIYRAWDARKYEELLRRFSLPSDKKFKDFSRGMKMKLGIAIAMSHGSRLLLLDEPTGGLDPVIRDDVLDLLLDFTRDEDHSILISSHIVSDLEKLCDYIAFLHKGKLILCEEKDRLCEEYCTVHCPKEELSTFPIGAVKYKKESGYGCEAIVRRESVPESMEAGPLSIEELFIFMVKEDR